ncbi:hypothetical protein BDP27DRAFT_1517398 [Rhodocollybia butyracea]|uniref:Uncharacterized protein n=1 Tax=Rhodocollybia butyracea TaxID=206335 RepID=A0A9P5TX04_9AGAR|nr:hypothetical protein BDP27DRAFT_1517398 [Rhodocollybia butyracea]
MNLSGWWRGRWQGIFLGRVAAAPELPPLNRAWMARWLKELKRSDPNAGRGRGGFQGGGRCSSAIRSSLDSTHPSSQPQPPTHAYSNTVSSFNIPKPIDVRERGNGREKPPFEDVFTGRPRPVSPRFPHHRSETPTLTTHRYMSNSLQLDRYKQKKLFSSFQPGLHQMTTPNPSRSFLRLVYILPLNLRQCMLE